MNNFEVFSNEKNRLKHNRNNLCEAKFVLHIFETKSFSRNHFEIKVYETNKAFLKSELLKPIYFRNRDFRYPTLICSQLQSCKFS